VCDFLWNGFFAESGSMGVDNGGVSGDGNEIHWGEWRGK